MRVSDWAACLAGAILVACASAPPPPPAPPTDEHDLATDDPPVPETVTGLDAPERALPPSTKSYDEALSTPEKLDVHDERAHLTDAQLTGPIRGVLSKCRVPSNARVTIKTAVQGGRAIGVTVTVRFERPKTSRPQPQTRAGARAEAKISAKIITCADRATRAVVWPPSSRRDSFTTEF